MAGAARPRPERDLAARPRGGRPDRPLIPDDRAARRIASRDGTPIAVFSWPPPAGATGRSARPILLVHGTAGDHTTFRVLGPLLATSFEVHAIDRRGRGTSGDNPPYAIEREFEDVAAVAESLAAGAGEAVEAVAVFGHSYGGRCALGAALRTDAISRVICYEGAPTPPGTSYRPTGLEARLRARLDAGDPDGAFSLFMSEVVGMSDEELLAYRANPVWPRRVAAAHTILRELEAEASVPASLDALGLVRQPVLQLLGSDSRAVFRTATDALDARLADGRIVEIEGAKHAAHHTDPGEVVRAVRAFLA